jgi:hypothetical protein
MVKTTDEIFEFCKKYVQAINKGDTKYVQESDFDRNKVWYSKDELEFMIKSLRDYCQKEYDKLTKDDYEKNIERVGQIRILNKLLEELKI